LTRRERERGERKEKRIEIVEGHLRRK